MQGTVKWFNSQRGFGFITGEDGTEYFTHWTHILINGYKQLVEGQAVSFTPETSEKGPIATNIQPGELPQQPPKSFRENIIQKAGDTNATQ